MNVDDRRTEIAARLEAATPGPWAWFGNVDNHRVDLSTTHSGHRYVMAFRRWGMQGAQPVFQQYEPGARTHGLMVPAAALPVFEVCRTALTRDDPRVYRGDLVAIRNPDAELIAHAPADIAWLLEATA